MTHIDQSAQQRNPDLTSPDYVIEKIAERYRLPRDVARVVVRLAGIGPDEGVRQ